MNRLYLCKNVIKNYKIEYFSIFVLVICMVFYVFFVFYDGVGIFPDSGTYINMMIHREPFYPIFLSFLRFLFDGLGVDYLLVAVFVQSILAAISSWSLIMYVKRKFHLHNLDSIFFLCILMVTALVWRFVEQQGCTYSNCISTEGIAVSCYLFFFRFLFEYMDHRDKKKLIVCCLLVFVLISTRKQMVISLLMLCICILVLSFRNKEYCTGVVTTLFCIIGILSANIILDCGYNYAVRGSFFRHSGDTRFVTTMIFYTADKMDSQWIEDEEIKKVFLDVYEACYDKKLLKESADDGWLNRISHFIDSYDEIQLYTMQPIINNYIYEERLNYKVDEIHKEADSIMNAINRILLSHNLYKIIGTIADNFLLGMVMTISHRRYSIIKFN